MKIKMFCRCSLFPSWSGKGLISTSGTLCGQNVELLNVTPGGKYSDHWALNVSWKKKGKTAKQSQTNNLQNL